MHQDYDFYLIEHKGCYYNIIPTGFIVYRWEEPHELREILSHIRDKLQSGKRVLVKSVYD